MNDQKRRTHHDYDAFLHSPKRLRTSSRTAAGGPSPSQKALSLSLSLSIFLYILVFVVCFVIANGGGGTGDEQEKKDNIGERVAALQQLVSPFGKSDTASVLTDAAAYIKFLHDQLLVLSAPYLQSSPNSRLQGGGESCCLRSRGLCLMPVAATILIARSNGADIWAPNSK